ncbi:MAG TPA: nitrite reductase small subunit NirD [Reyranella sp.]|nr:nitrite reductase small subunit NirD [Reyranella sp.]
MTMPWIDICALGDIPPRGSRVVRTARGQIALFRTAEDEIFALDNRCPHKGGPLSEGIVHGRLVTCPLHNWVIGLEDGQATGADKGCARRFPVRLEDGRVFLNVGYSAKEEGSS